MSTSKELLEQELNLRNRIEKYIELSKKTAIAKRTQGFFEARTKELSRLWEQYSALDVLVMQALSKDSASQATKEVDRTYITEDRFCNMEMKYSDYMSDLYEGLRKLKEEATNSNTNESATAIVVQQDTTLPRISLPKFNGDYDMWRSFSDMFTSLVHNNTKLSPVQKLHHLKSCLIGEAERVLRHTPITDADYQPAWDKLKKRYQNTRILVNHQLKLLVNQQKLTTETNKGIKALIDTSEECLQQLKSLNVDTSSWDTLLIYILVQKLPFYTLKLWEEDQGSNDDLPTFAHFTMFLNTRLKVLESISDVLGPRTTPFKPKPQPTQKIVAYHSIKEAKCPACGGKHYVLKCSKYNQMSPEAKRKAISSAGRCLNCLSSHHAQPECTSKHNCFKCNQRHHTSLHTAKENPIPHNNSNYKSKDSKSSQAESNPENNSHSADNLEITQAFLTRQNIKALLATALVNVRGKHGQTNTLRCLIDPGSESSFLTEDACKRLGAACSPTSIVITCINKIPVENSGEQTTLQLQSSQLNGPIVEETFLILKGITDTLPRQRMSKEHSQHLVGLNLADPTYWKPGKIDALLGINVYAQIIQNGIIRGSKYAPVAQNTIFGWILLGPTANQLHNHAIALMTTTEDDISQKLQQFFEIEEFPSNPVLKAEDVACQSIFQATHQRLSNGQYQVQLPFINSEIPKLGESRPQALTRFIALQNQLRKKPDLAKDYTKCLDEYIQLGHMEMVTPSVNHEHHYYIPHHAVFKESTTTKLRVVFDASCKSTNGKSLNDYLLKGPILQPKLFATLMNWRRYKIAITADIEKMYRMILVHPSQRAFQRIIWKHPTTNEIQDYQLKTVTFGTSAAPYLAIRTLQQLAEDEKDNWPLASKATFKSFYVDDLLTGADDVTSAKNLQRELIEMMKTGGFNLRKWASNDLELLSHLPSEYCEIKESFSIGEIESIKTLGIQWHPAEDIFTFKISLRSRPAVATKRVILSEIASLYDPLGWLAPILIVAKTLMQSLWITGCSWDVPVPISINEQWNKFKEDLHNLPRLKIPRWIRYTSTSQIQIHGFCDASTKAYAAVLYLRTILEDGSISSMLLTAKTRVAPTKPTTIPRLELNGAVILARLIKATVKDMDLENASIFAWTDSTIVLQWIREHPSRWKTYVANRVVEIQDSLKYDSWQHVPTADNPADLASRGTTADELLSKEIWWHGPEWLTKSEEHWPKLDKCEEGTELEAKRKTTATYAMTIQDDYLMRYSSFDKLIRTTAYLLRFLENCKPSSTNQVGLLSPGELCKAETTILRLVQKVSFPNEYHALSNKQALSHKSKLIQLSPFLDDQGLLRLKGRLSHATLGYDKKHPIILPKTHHVVESLIDKLHQDTFHGGTSLVLSISRDKYWILDARRAISSRIHKCITCVRFRKTTCQQRMGDLPEFRVNVTKPFSKVGIDYAGPITIKSSPCRRAKLLKAYICIFVCMATRAIHIELVSSLTADAFIAALKRFIARRGLCTDIYSDCGSNFIGAIAILDKDLKHAIVNSNQEAAKYASTRSINWHLNPPAAPHFGGTWEAGVRSIKGHLRRSLGNMTCTFEEYATLLSQIEAILNSRPLCYISADPSNPEIITPGHFLIGQALNTLPEPDYSNEPSLTHRWKFLQQRTHQFWKKWSRDYLNQLQTRSKWQLERENLQIGDVVLVTHEHMPPIKWPLGIVEEVFPGADGLVRVAQIKTQLNTFRRPVVKLVRLPIAKT